jgi:hypothetical protein
MRLAGRTVLVAERNEFGRPGAISTAKDRSKSKKRRGKRGEREKKGGIHHARRMWQPVPYCVNALSLGPLGQGGLDGGQQFLDGDRLAEIAMDAER